MSESDRETEQLLSKLRRDIEIADEQLRQGKVAPFDPHATLERVRREKSTQKSRQ